MITISQCSDSEDWSYLDRLMFQIYNGVETTYTRAISPTEVRSLGAGDFNKLNDYYSFYYKEQE